MLCNFICVFVVALLAPLFAQLDAYVMTQSLGCHHNGTWYADRSLVPTMEKCLTCQCQRKTLVCRLKVCPEMPMPPPRGCIVVQQRHSCCPYLSCARLDAFYKIPATRRIIAYLDHYERESIDRVVNDNMLQRRSSDDNEVDMLVCVKNGTVYKSGSAMSSSNLCTYCYCIGGKEKCVKPKCMLPVEGCKPIFVDSTCCPVRYDCTSKPAGKSSQEVRYRKTANKHYLRMSQRLQRNRGCTVNRQFYVEGQKMRSDADKPCDVCFCIRGARRCAPKKCAPALKNCMPVVPKGQCCPSSYDCAASSSGSSSSTSQRAHNSRQFNLFSLLFGKEDELNGNDTKRLPPIEYPPDRHPSVTMQQHHKNVEQKKEDEKSILDTIREGLEIIDGNNDEVIGENIADKLTTVPLTTIVGVSQKEDDVSTQTTAMDDDASTEVSFLDLLLGNDEDEGALSTTKMTTEESASDFKTTITPAETISWVDLLLGTDEDNNKTAGTTTLDDEAETSETTESYQKVTSIDRIDQDFGGGEDLSGSGEIFVGEQQSNEFKVSASHDVLGLNKLRLDMEQVKVAEKKEDMYNNLEQKTDKIKEIVEETRNPTMKIAEETRNPMESTTAGKKQTNNIKETVEEIKNSMETTTAAKKQTNKIKETLEETKTPMESSTAGKKQSSKIKEIVEETRNPNMKIAEETRNPMESTTAAKKQTNQIKETVEEIKNTMESTTAAKKQLASTKRPQTTVTTKKVATTIKATTKNASTKPPTTTKSPSTIAPQNSTLTKPKTTKRPPELKFVTKATENPIKKIYKATTTIANTTTIPPLNATMSPITKAPAQNEKNGLLTVLLDGLSDMLKSENGLNGTQKRIPPKGNRTTTKTITTTTKMPAKPATTVSHKTPTKSATKVTTSTSPFATQSQPLPSFKPLPTDKPAHTRINSKIANLTTPTEAVKTSVTPIVAAFKTLPTENVKVPLDEKTTTHAPMIVTESTASSTRLRNPSTTTKAKPPKESPQPESTTSSTEINAKSTESEQTRSSSTIATTAATTTTAAAAIPPTLTPKPLVIKTNPTILEADPFDADNAQPTLPPSLPNLKIIPFLPTDAVKANRNKLPYDYYHSQSPTAKIDYDQYDEGSMYPAITEPHFPIFPADVEEENDNKAEYIYKFNVEGPSPPVTSSTAGKLDGTKVSAAASAFVKYDFAGSDVEHKGGFSPPTKTEGGFVPKDPLLLNDEDDEERLGVLPYVDSGYQATKHIIDITTSAPFEGNITKVIEITTPDPFKDVIRTEPPPDLTSLIEYREKILIQKPTLIKTFADPENPTQTLIHITTDTPPPPPPQPAAAEVINDTPLPHHPETIIDSGNVDEQTAKPTRPNEEHKNAITSFLDLLLGVDSDPIGMFSESNESLSSSTVPPFKSLPQATVTLLSDINGGITNATTPIAHREVIPTTKITVSPTTTTAKVNMSTKSTTSKSPSTTTPDYGDHLFNTTSIAIVAGTRAKSKPKRPAVIGSKPASPLNSTATSRPKFTRPKLSSSRRQTSKPSVATDTAYFHKRLNSTTTAPTTTRSTTSSTTTSTPPTTRRQYFSQAPPTTKPLMRSPFDTLPFMDPSFEVKRTTERPFVVGGQHAAENDYFGLLQYKNSLNHFEGLDQAQERFPASSSNPTTNSPTSSTITTTTKRTSVPLVQRNIDEIISAAIGAQSDSKLDTATATRTTPEIQHATSNNLIDPAGVLKLAGCNIYGRMYRVGRIILELSSPCVECKCTEVGVKCGKIDC